MEARPSRSGRLGVSDGRSGGGGGGGGGGVSSAVVSSMSSAEHVRSMKQFLSGALAGGISKTTTAPLARMTILYQVEGMPGVVSVPNVVQPAGRATATTAAAATAATGGASAQGNVNFGARMAGGGTVSTSGTGAASGARPPLLHAIKEVVRREGIRSLWKGNGAMLLHRLPYSGSNFYAYETMTAFLKPRNVSGAADETLPWMYRWKLHCLVSGAVAATIAATVAYPLDLLRTRLAVHGGRDMNIEKTFFAIVQRDGVAGLYRGLGPTLAQVSPCIASSFWAYELGLDTWRRLGAHAPDEKAPPLVTVAAGAFSGFVSSSLTYPLDLARRRCQVDATASRRSMMEHIRDIVTRKGVRGLYSGIIFEYYKVVPGMAITYFFYETIKRSLG